MDEVGVGESGVYMPFCWHRKDGDVGGAIVVLLIMGVFFRMELDYDVFTRDKSIIYSTRYLRYLVDSVYLTDFNGRWYLDQIT